MRRLALLALLGLGFSCRKPADDLPAREPTGPAHHDQRAPAPPAPNPPAPSTSVAAAKPPSERRSAKPCPGEVAKEMACVEGGWFLRGSQEGAPDERPREQVFVETFLMDRYEVKNQDYEACVREKKCARRRQFEGYVEPEQPVVAVSWFDAVGFCESRAKRLPSEAEFERAASGPATTPFPWGTQASGCDQAIVETSRGKGCGRGTTWPVGSRAAGHFGLFDVAGNVWEWVGDWYSACYSGCADACGEACAGENPKGPCGGAAECPGRSLRVVRGGSWFYPIERARASARRGSKPENDRGPHRFGFRCARDA